MEAAEEAVMAFDLLPPPKDVCQECGVSEVPDHVPDGKIGTVKVFPADDEGRSSNP